MRPLLSRNQLRKSLKRCRANLFGPPLTLS